VSGPSLAYGPSRARHDEKDISALQLNGHFYPVATVAQALLHDGLLPNGLAPNPFNYG
jgi:hypothetical protein